VVSALRRELACVGILEFAKCNFMLGCHVLLLICLNLVVACFLIGSWFASLRFKYLLCWSIVTEFHAKVS